jgi:hypothetical protein
LITRQLQAAEVLSKLSTIKDNSSFVKDPLVITKQLVITKKLKLYFNNSSRIPTLDKYRTVCLGSKTASRILWSGTDRNWDMCVGS